MSKEAYYFSHDANARHDPKILAMRSEYGLQGYGLYWVVIEMLREASDFKLPLKKYVWKAIAMQMDAIALQNNANAMQTDATDYAKKFVQSCIDEFDLFASDGEFFWSNSLNKRMDKKNDLSEKRREAARKRWEKKNNVEETNTNAMQTDAIAMQVYANAMQVDARKGKERKGKESKVNKNNNNNNEQQQTNPFEFYQQNFGVLSPYMGEQIGQWVDDLNDELVIEAMKITLRAGKKWNYANGILKDWHRNNVKSVDEARASNKPEGNNPNGVNWEELV